MDDTYIRDLESAYELTVDRITTLEQEKEKADQTLNRKKEYLQDVIYCLSNKLPASDRWEALQEISKMDRKHIEHENANAELIVALVNQRLGFKK